MKPQVAPPPLKKQSHAGGIKVLTNTNPRRRRVPFKSAKELVLHAKRRGTINTLVPHTHNLSGHPNLDKHGGLLAHEPQCYPQKNTFFYSLASTSIQVLCTLTVTGKSFTSTYPDSSTSPCSLAPNPRTLSGNSGGITIL